jgi:hypothetical protein
VQKYTCHLRFWKYIGEVKKILSFREATFVVNTTSKQIEKIANYAFIEEYEFKNKLVKLIRYSFENKEEAEEMEIDDKETFDQIIENNKFLIEEFRLLINKEEQDAFDLLMYIYQYVSFDSFKLGAPQKINLMKAKLRAKNCNTLYNKAIEYKAINLNKIIKSN